ncbi:hypothetical protein HPULCUR_003304 [Helicostylum pulchrum]|uniref:Uncharacterized protein n=1 Tax=Helicostylum pulchrum TaxID=562976 RepID=A0ABP9XT13_9FUNG
MQTKCVLSLLVACIIMVNAKPVSYKRSTLSEKNEVFEPMPPAAESPAESPTSKNVSEADIEDIIAETEARVNAVISENSYY